MKRLLALIIAINLSFNGLHARPIPNPKTRKDRSIQGLVRKASVPSIGRYQKRLNLSYKEIDNLKGLDEVRNIRRVAILRLDNNDIATIPQGSFVPVEENLQVLNLSNNKLTQEGLKGLIGLRHLRALILNSNQIEDISQDLLDGLPKLSFISLYGNPISIEKINQLRHKGYYVSVLPITRASLLKAGLGAVGLAGLILGAVGSVKLVKERKAAKYRAKALEEAKKALLEYQGALENYKKNDTLATATRARDAALEYEQALARAEELADTSVERRELSPEEMEQKIEEFEKGYVGTTLEDAKKEVLSRPNSGALTEEEIEKEARKLMVEASKKRIAEAIRTAEEHSQRTKRLDPYAQAQLDQELLNLKSKEGTPLVTKVKEIDTDTEDEE